MNFKSMALVVVAALLLAMQSKSMAETTGFSQVSVPANSDVIVSVPFSRDVAASLVVNSVSGSNINVTNTLTPNQYQTLFLVRFTSGAATGRWSTISGNGANQLTLANAAVLTGVVAGDKFDVLPHQTLDSVFPDSFQGYSFRPSTSAFVRSTEVLFLSEAVGTNKSAAETYFFLGSANEWRRVGSGLNFDKKVINPQQGFIVRNNSTSTLNLLTFGDVLENSQVSGLTVASQANDVIISTGQPVGVRLGDLNLGGTPAFVTSVSAFVRRDELLVFNNAATGRNKSAAVTYFYLGGATPGWRRVGSGSIVDNDVLPAGSAFIVRKFSGTPGSVNWSVPAAVVTP